jgi:hypothetical protein
MRLPVAVRPETKRLVDEAVVNCAVVPEIAVVDAYGIESDAVVGATKLMVRPLPPTSALVPESEIAVPAVAVVVATVWSAPVPEPKRRLPEVNDAAPVPPWFTAS